MRFAVRTSRSYNEKVPSICGLFKFSENMIFVSKNIKQFERRVSDINQVFGGDLVSQIFATVSTFYEVQFFFL